VLLRVVLPLTVAVVAMSALGLPWPLVLIAAASAAGVVFGMAMTRASANADREMDEVIEHLARVAGPPSARERPLAQRVRRAAARWPLTELDPIERATFAGAVAQARDFADLDPHWQELIIASECGSRPVRRRVHETPRRVHR
jgi:hypothetical protein